MGIRANIVRSRVLLVLVAALASSGVAAQAASACEVQNATTKATFATLQAGVTAAAAGNTLKIIGTCEGNTIIEKSLTITGKSTTAPTLKGSGAYGPVVLIAHSTTVTISKLTITGGTGNLMGGGIDNEGTLTVSNATISGNTQAGEGGGIYNGGALTLVHSIVTGNTAADGGGIANENILKLQYSTVSGNTAEYSQGNGGGIYEAKGGPLTLEHSTVSGNTATHQGGGIYDEFGHEATLSNSTLSGNTAEEGGGIFTEIGPITLQHSIVKGNTASFSGGGIYNAHSGVTVTESVVTGNDAGEDGGGLFNGIGAVVLLNPKTKITKNKATIKGGGIYDAHEGKVVEAGGTVTSNTPENLYTEP